MKWVRLEENQKVKKLQEILKKIPNYYPSKDDSKYEHYPYKYKNGTFGIYCVGEYFALAPIDVYMRRLVPKILASLETPVIIISKWKNNRRYNIPMVICNIKYGQSMSGQYITVYGIDFHSEYIEEKFSIYDLTSIVFAYLSEKERNTLWNIFSSTPPPNKECMKIHEYYKENYKLYKKDCKKYGFPIMEQCLLERMLPDEYLDKNGYFVNYNSDYKVVNNE